MLLHIYAMLYIACRHYHYRTYTRVVLLLFPCPSVGCGCTFSSSFKQKNHNVQLCLISLWFYAIYCLLCKYSQVICCYNDPCLFFRNVTRYCFDSFHVLMVKNNSTQSPSCAQYLVIIHPCPLAFTVFDCLVVDQLCLHVLHMLQWRNCRQSHYPSLYN